MAKPKVFVSHSHLDDAFAERLVKDLRAAGADAWLDKEDVGAGDFQERISEALDKCEWFVLVLTNHALASHWVRQEVHAANSLKHAGQIRSLIFVQAGPIEHRELPALWRVYNIFDATTDYGNAQSRMLKALGLSPHLQPAAPQRAPQPQSARAPTASQAQPVEQAPMQAKAPIAPPSTPSLTGKWKEADDEIPWMFAITQIGQTLTGAAAVNALPESVPDTAFSLTGQVSGEEITFGFDSGEHGRYVFRLRLVEGKLVGTYKFPSLARGNGLSITLVRH